MSKTQEHIPKSGMACGCRINVALAWEDREVIIFCPLHAAAEGLLQTASAALMYLEHPEAQALPFALPAKNAAKNLRAAIARAGGK